MNKKGKALPIQTLTFQSQLPQIQQQPTQQPRQPPKPSQSSNEFTTNPYPQSSFSDFMKQKMLDSEVKKVYEDAANKPIGPQSTSQKIASKPFQIKQSQTSSSFTSNNNSNRKPYNQFYQPSKVRTIDDSIPRPQSEKRNFEDQSYVSTEKSDDISNELESKSMKSETFSISKSSQDLPNLSSKSFVEKKRQEINFDQKQWVKKDPPKYNLQTKEFKDILIQAEQLVQSRDKQRQSQRDELENYVESRQTAQRESRQQINDEQELEKQIQLLAAELEIVENQELEQKMKSDIMKFKQIIEPSLDNDSQISQLSLKQRSMFLTELLKHRELFKNKITGEEQQPEQNLQDQEECVDEIERKLEQKQENIKDLALVELPAEFQKRLDELLSDIDTFKPGQQNFANPFIIPKERLKDVHQKIKKYNPKFNENADLEFDKPGVLPKDKTLRQEAIDRILEIKSQEVNDALQKLVVKGNTLEERPKMQAMIEQVKKMTTYVPSEYLNLRMQQINLMSQTNDKYQKELANIECKSILNEFSDYKQKLDVSIKQSRELLEQSSLTDVTDNLNKLHEYQEKIKNLEAEYQVVQDIINSLDQTTQLQEIPEIDEQANEDLEIKFPQQEEKSIIELDDEITHRVMQDHPELFDDE